MYAVKSTPEQKAAKAAKRAQAAADAAAFISANPTPSSFPSQTARLAWYKAKLLMNQKWALRTLALIYSAQTEGEKAQGATVVWNGAGFGAFDAEILTDMAKRVEKWNGEATHQYAAPLSPAQMALMQSLIAKYAGQLIDNLSIQGQAIPVIHVKKTAPPVVQITEGSQS